MISITLVLSRPKRLLAKLTTAAVKTDTTNSTIPFDLDSVHSVRNCSRSHVDDDASCEDQSSVAGGDDVALVGLLIELRECPLVGTCIIERRQR